MYRFEQLLLSALINTSIANTSLTLYILHHVFMEREAIADAIPP